MKKKNRNPFKYNWIDDLAILAVFLVMVIIAKVTLWVYFDLF